MQRFVIYVLMITNCEDIMSDGDKDNSKDKINSPTFGNRTPKCVNNGKRLCNGDAKLLCSKCTGFYTKIMNNVW